jgi:prepilin-type N-terminal cleavage/methylation domain-containing protein
MHGVISMDTNRARRRTAFTLVELLVVIAIIGTLIGLLLPAVQAARESARRSRCSNNLKQYGLGMQNYHDAHEVLPLGMSDWPCTDGGWMPVLWPFIELGDLASQFTYNTRFISWPNVGNTAQGRPLSIPVPLYYCPSDRPNAVDSPSGTRVARSNYTTNATAIVRSGVTYRGPFVSYYNGSKKDCGATGWVPFDPRGYKGQEATRFRTITDGLSKTLLMSEQNLVATDNEPSDPRGEIWRSWGFTTSHATPNSAFDIVGNWWIAPPSRTCANIPPHLPVQPASTGGDIFRFAARSKHPDGVQTTFCDGSVRFIANSIDLSTWQAAGTMSGGEAVNQ